MAKDNEYSGYFDDAPVAAKPARKTAAETAPADAAVVDTAPPDAASENKDNPYLNDYGISRENATRIEANRVAVEKQKKKEQQDQAAKVAAERELERNINLAVAAGGAGLGMAAREKYGSPMDLTKGPAGNAYTQWLEKKFNLPAGSWQAFQKQREILAGSDPAVDAWARNMEQQAAAKAPVQNVVIEQATAPPLPIEEKTSGMYRSMLPNVGDPALMPSAAQLAEVTSTRADDRTGLPKLVVENANSINVARNLGYDPLQAQRYGEAGIYLPPKSSKQIAQEAQADAQAKFIDNLEQAFRTPILPSDVPLMPPGALPTKAAAAPVAAPLPQTAAEYRAAIVPAQAKAQSQGKMAGRAMAGVGGALTLEQAYQMARDYYKTKKMPDWTQFTSLAGGPLATFGGPKLGILGGLMQLPYVAKHHEAIARGLTVGDVMPEGTYPESERNTPISQAGQ
jgi:hypothetical protein